jgi:tRNA wybutosine-synthesizing protein 1
MWRQWYLKPASWLAWMAVVLIVSFSRHLTWIGTCCRVCGYILLLIWGFQQWMQPKEESAVATSPQSDNIKTVKEITLRHEMNPLEQENKCDTSSSPSLPSIMILYGSQTGTAKKLAQLVEQTTIEAGLPTYTMSLADYDTDLYACESRICVFIISTYTEGTPPDEAAWFYRWLSEIIFDFRVDKTYLSGLKYAVFGLGNSLYQDHFNKVARHVNTWLAACSATRICPLGEGDVDQNLEETFQVWKKQLLVSLGMQKKDEKMNTFFPEPITITKEEEEKDEGDDDEGEGDEGDDDEDEENSNVLMDMEDLGTMMDTLQTSKKERIITSRPPIRDMITPMLRESLTKQGYRLIGSHSGVKMCRWTKAMLRGRGGCYKHSFYGIESHRCMEMTPSLACANKCVFCWRHHTNPVGTEWKWSLDEPDIIFTEAVEHHLQMIKQMKGVPGVLPERFEEALNIRHCALSLVGEPIMYPQINEFIGLLHGHRISSFLVTNAQFPEQIARLKPVTQLYLSIDAPTRDTLKTIDRPLFKDFWERFIACIEALSKKTQRTVFRLTLVKDYNVCDIQNYVELIRKGQPEFIETKGVTYCGSSSASSLTLSNVPYHQEVIAFVRQLAEHLIDYEIACEHAHSCSILLAHKKFKINGRWHTWIDYERFHELVQSGRPFTSLDYIQETPVWALFGAAEQGFDPKDTRFYRKSKSNNHVSSSPPPTATAAAVVVAG